MKDPIDTQLSKCIIGFDVWGTILDLNKVLTMIAISIASKTGLNTDNAIRKIFKVHSEARKLRRLNPYITVEKLFNKSREMLAEEFNTSQETILSAIEDAFKSPTLDVVYSDTLSTLELLSKRGIKLGIIGNVLFWPSNYTRLILEKTGLLAYYTSTVFSDEVGVNKPDREIFLVFTEKMKVDPDKLIYVGDNVVEDVGGALSIGGIGVLISRSGSRDIILPELRVALITSLLKLVDVYEAFCE